MVPQGIVEGCCAVRGATVTCHAHVCAPNVASRLGLPPNVPAPLSRMCKRTVFSSVGHPLLFKAVNYSVVLLCIAFLRCLSRTMAWYTIAASNRSYHGYGHQLLCELHNVAPCSQLAWPQPVAVPAADAALARLTRWSLPLNGNYARLRYRSQYIRGLNGIRVRVVCYVRAYMGLEEATLS